MDQPKSQKADIPNTSEAPVVSGLADHFYADKSDEFVARHINLALLLCDGISEQNAGFDLVTTINDAGLLKIARIIGDVRRAAVATARREAQ